MSHPGETVLSSLPILPSLEARLNIFRSAFSHPSSFENFVGLTAGSLLSVKNPTVADSIRAANLTQYKHFSAFYRFFHRALWEPDLIGWIFLSVFCSMSFSTTGPRPSWSSMPPSIHASDASSSEPDSSTTLCCQPPTGCR